MTRSQIALAFGLCGGDFNTLTPSLSDRLVEMVGKDAVAIVNQVFVPVLESDCLA